MAAATNAATERMPVMPPCERIEPEHEGDAEDDQPDRLAQLANRASACAGLMMAPMKAQASTTNAATASATKK